MIMGVSRGRVRGRPVPPDDARLLQGAAVHGRRLGHRRDGRRAVARQDGRLPQGDAVHVRLLRRSAASRCRASRRSRASSPRTRSCSSWARRGGWHWALYVVGYIGAFLTAIYTFRMIFRAFFGEPVRARRASSSTATCTTPPEPFNPANGEIEDTDVGFPGPEHTIAERALPMRVAMALLAVSRSSAASCQIPKSTTWLDDVPRADVRGLDDPPAPTNDGLLVVRPGPRRGARPRSASRSRTGSGCAARARARSWRARFSGLHRCSSTSGTSTS